MEYCNIKGIAVGNEGEDYRPVIYYKGWTIPVEDVENPMWEIFKDINPTVGRNDKKFFDFIHNNAKKVFEILDKITG